MSAINLVQASNSSASEVIHVLHSKFSDTNFFLAACEFKRMKSIGRFKIEIWCMDLAYIDKLAKRTNGVEYLQTRREFFDRTLVSEGMRAKESK